jgi:FRG domain
VGFFGEHDENQLLQMFRVKAPTFARGEVPSLERTDQWLFLAQHVGLPIRLLDWTESALLALYFALQNETPVVWMINPIELNQKNAFPLTWYVPEGKARNIGIENIKSAWEPGYAGLDFPVAIIPAYLHERMRLSAVCSRCTAIKRSLYQKLFLLKSSFDTKSIRSRFHNFSMICISWVFIIQRLCQT